MNFAMTTMEDFTMNTNLANRLQVQAAQPVPAARQIGILALLAAGLVGMAMSHPASATGNCGFRGNSESKRPLMVMGLTADQKLVKFRECKPGRARTVGAISGLLTPDTQLVGIDYRVQDGQLYGLGNGGGIYTVDPGTGAATQVSKLTVALMGTNFGVDFNPAANALRILSDTGQNLRHPFAGPLAGQTQTDMALNYTAGTPATGINGAAYTNNDLDAATGTSLFDLDSERNQIALQSPPNNGSLVLTGSLTVDPDSPAGFDIYSRLRNNVTVSNSAYAALTVGGQSGFYRTNLLTGGAELIDYFPVPVVDIAIPLEQ
jgi:hypothetical protein